MASLLAFGSMPSAAYSVFVVIMAGTVQRPEASDCRISALVCRNGNRFGVSIVIRHLVFALFATLFAFFAHADIVDIDNAELARLAAAGVPVIDVRTPGEWKESGVVAGSKLITLFDAQGNADPAWLTKVKEVAKPRQPVVSSRSGSE